MKTFHRRVLALLTVIVGAAAASAQISPGKLSRFHEKLEGISGCTNCHELGHEVSLARCLGCHTAIGKRVQAAKGYHGSAGVRARHCRECHSEHNGRDFDLVHWLGGREAFAHAVTGFALAGVHARRPCEACHRADFRSNEEWSGDANVNSSRTYLGLKTGCLQCHADEHQGQLPDDCAGCHGFDSWSPAPGFSHARARFDLTGKHTDVACDKCHPRLPANEAAAGKIRNPESEGTHASYSGLRFGQCSDCHEDPHGSRLGPSCDGCHVTGGFAQTKKVAFDHTRTAFLLEGRHVQVDCRRCHRSGRMTAPLKHARCLDCHEDYHRGIFASFEGDGDCAICHTVQVFSPSTFDLKRHDSTSYPLTGSHLAVPCVFCHRTELQNGVRTTRFEFDDMRCQSCHPDPHEGQLDHWVRSQGCEFCHSTETWHGTSFDHKLARFPLEGKHREILCLQCHSVRRTETGQETVWLKPLTLVCAGCHQDPHHGQFVRADLGEETTECRRCHTSRGWSDLVFDHKRDSRFVVDGAHASLACLTCHKQETVDSTAFVRYCPLDTECSSCHTSGH